MKMFANSRKNAPLQSIHVSSFCYSRVRIWIQVLEKIRIRIQTWKKNQDPDPDWKEKSGSSRSGRIRSFFMYHYEGCGSWYICRILIFLKYLDLDQYLWIAWIGIRILRGYYLYHPVIQQRNNVSARSARSVRFCFMRAPKRAHLWT